MSIYSIQDQKCVAKSGILDLSQSYMNTINTLAGLKADTKRGMTARETLGNRGCSVLTLDETFACHYATITYK